MTIEERLKQAEETIKKAQDILFAYTDNEITSDPWWAVVRNGSFGRMVILEGPFFSRERAEKLAQSQENVKTVVNDLAVMAPSSLTQRTKDTVTTSQIKAAFIDAKDLQSNSIKVVTERGIVYLMGRVTSREAKRATEIARGVGGVTKVVRVFEDISEEELKRLSQPPMGK